MLALNGARLGTGIALLVVVALMVGALIATIFTGQLFKKPRAFFEFFIILLLAIFSFVLALWHIVNAFG